VDLLAFPIARARFPKRGDAPRENVSLPILLRGHQHRPVRGFEVRLRGAGASNPARGRHVEKQDSSRQERAVDPPKKTREPALRNGPFDEVVEALADAGHGDRRGNLDVVEGTSPKRPLGDATARESQHGRGGVNTEDLIPPRRRGARRRSRSRNRDRRRGRLRRPRAPMPPGGRERRSLRPLRNGRRGYTRGRSGRARFHEYNPMDGLSIEGWIWVSGRLVREWTRANVGSGVPSAMTFRTSATASATAGGDQGTGATSIVPKEAGLRAAPPRVPGPGLVGPGKADSPVMTGER